MPIQFWIFLIPAAILLICGIYTLHRRRRWPSFSVGLIACDAFFLFCMMIVNMQISAFSQLQDLAMDSLIDPLSFKRITAAIVHGPVNIQNCTEAYTWLQVLTVIFLIATVVSMVLECYRIFSAPPELLKPQKKLSEQEERLRHRSVRPLRTKERKPDSHERKNKL